MILGIIPKGTSFSWRYGDSYAESDLNFEEMTHVAQEAERGLFDLVFMADSVALRDDRVGIDKLKGSGTATYFDAMTLLGGLAAVTKHIGLAATISTTYNHPYHIARKLATVDHISHGRAGWNVITSGQDSESYNFGYDGQLPGEVRYERAQECLQTVLDLWDSWEDGAVVRDKKAGVYFDPAKVHALHHEGKHFKVRGPLNLSRPPQGHPVICQAGGSAAGWELAARYSDLLFAKALSFKEAQRFYQEAKGRLAKYGRTPDQLRVMPEMRAVVGKTEKEAREKLRAIQDCLTEEEGRATLQHYIPGIDFSDFKIDEPIPDLPHINQAASRFRVFLTKDDRRLTLREMIETGFGSWTLVGTPGQVADAMIEWFHGGAADGFNFSPHCLPSGLTDFVDLVIPELQERGVFRTSYEGGTLREIMGLNRPANKHTVARTPAKMPPAEIAVTA